MAGRTEDYVQRRVEQLTLFGAVRLVATVALTLAFVAACLELLVDSGINGFGTAVWWAIVTVTTVGYGDVVPETAVGRFVAGLLMLVGVSTIPIATSLVVSVLISRVQRQQHVSDLEAQADVAARLERIEQALARMVERTEPNA